MKELQKFWEEEDGVGIIEVILILVILVAIVLIFREKIVSIVSSAFQSITGNADTINSDVSLD